MKDRQQGSQIWVILSFLGLLLFFILLHWNSFQAPFERDEGEYAYSAWLLRQNIAPYKNSFIQKPPLIIYTYALAQLISPWALWPPRLLAAIASAGTIFFVYLISKHEFSQKTGLIASWLLTPMILLPYLSPFAANTEKFLLLPLMITLAIYVYNRNKTNCLPWLLAGITSALTLLYKQIVILIILFIIGLWLKKNWSKYETKVLILKNVGCFLLGVILVSSLAFAYFIINRAGSSLWEDIVLFNRYYPQTFGLTLHPLFHHLKLFFSCWWILFLFLVWFCYQKPAHWRFYLALLLLTLASVSFSPIGHYYILLMPFWAIITSSAIVSLIDYLKKNQKIKSPAKATAITVFLTLLIMLWPFRKQFFMSPQELSLWVYGTANPFLESPLVAKHLAEITSPQDFVFIAGSEPQILFYSQRKSSSRFVITYPLNIKTPKRIIYQQEAITDLKSHPPQAIVLSRRQFSGLWSKKSPPIFINYLSHLLRQNYQLVGGYVWRNNQGSWQEPITKKEVNNSSLLLFRKK